MSRWYILLLVCVSLSHVHASTDGEKDFNGAGWPTMVMLFGPALLIYTIASGCIQHGFVNLLQHKLFLLFHVVLLFCAIILTFGPGAGGNAPVNLPPVNILGLQLWFLVFIGIHIIFGSNKYVKWVYFVIGVFTVLGLTGSLSSLGYGAAVTRVNSEYCLIYFVQSDNLSYQRCDDKGFLQLIRTCGTSAIFILFATISQIFLELTDNISSTANAHSTTKSQDANEPLMNDQTSPNTSYQSGSGDETPPTANRDYNAL